MAKKKKTGSKEGLKVPATSKSKKSPQRAGNAAPSATPPIEKATPRPRKRAATRKPSRARQTAKVISTEATPVIAQEQIQLRAYFISERRRNMGWPGDKNTDWVEAERQLRAEAVRAAIRNPTGG